MGIYDHAMGLSCDTGWNNCSLVHLLCAFIDENGLTDKAAAHLDKVAEEEMAECSHPDAVETDPGCWYCPLCETHLPGTEEDDA
jgi:hypothetical protein